MYRKAEWTKNQINLLGRNLKTAVEAFEERLEQSLYSVQLLISGVVRFQQNSAKRRAKSQ